MCFPTRVDLAYSHRREKSNLASFSAGLIPAVALSQPLRTWNAGFDISTHGWSQAIGWVLAAVAGFLVIRELRGPLDVEERGSPVRFGKLAAAALGLNCGLVLLYFAFTAPNVIPRWTGANYLLVVLGIGLTLTVYTMLTVSKERFLDTLTPGVVLIWNIVFTLALVAAILPHQIKFPGDPNVYPLYEPPLTPLAYVPLILALLLFPILFIDIAIFTRAFGESKPSPRALGGAFAIGSLFTLVMIFTQVFTTVYAYIPVVGPFFRDKFWAGRTYPRVAPFLGGSGRR